MKAMCCLSESDRVGFAKKIALRDAGDSVGTSECLSVLFYAYVYFYWLRNRRKNMQI